MPEIPIVNLIEQTRTIISPIDGFNKCVCTFTVNQDVYKWEARASKNSEQPSRGEGELVERGSYLPRGKEASVIVDYNELNQGDGKYTISVYAQSYNGYWSDGSYENSYVGFMYNMGSYNKSLKYNCQSMNNNAVLLRTSKGVT